MSPIYMKPVCKHKMVKIAFYLKIQKPDFFSSKHHFGIQDCTKILCFYTFLLDLHIFAEF